jgi:hypothetical protein
MLDNGVKVKELVDEAIDACGRILNLREEIAQCFTKAETVRRPTAFFCVSLSLSCFFLKP